jgi:hypothetical protein
MTAWHRSKLASQLLRPCEQEEDKSLMTLTTLRRRESGAGSGVSTKMAARAATKATVMVRLAKPIIFVTHLDGHI